MHSVTPYSGQYVESGDPDPKFAVEVRLEKSNTIVDKEIQMALMPPFFLSSVVALGVSSSDGTIQYNGLFVWSSYWRNQRQRSKTYWPFLVTNRHVFQKAFERKNKLRSIQYAYGVWY